MNSYRFVSLSLVLSFLLLAISDQSDAHLLMRNPPPRGGLAGVYNWMGAPVDRNAPQDLKIHFPSGNKAVVAGGGLKSQIAAAGGRQWTPFRPMLPGYHWRYGVCGDDKTSSPQEHLRGGWLYYGARRVRSYREGQDIDIEVSTIFHHGGFLMYHICDVSRCTGRDLTENCFKRPGVCKLLRRAEVPECEDNRSERCGPIDRNHPERWYLPCSKKVGGYEVYGQSGTIKYKLPQGFSCRHCVLHQLYQTGDRCNPNGYGAYFNGSYAPKAWSSCPAIGFPVDGKHGLYNPNELNCGVQRRYTEDYAHCADIEIVATRRRN